jgi:nucleoside-diphosphate-sugar epimerase
MSDFDHLLITGGSGFVGQSILDELATSDFVTLPKQITVLHFSNEVKIPSQLLSRTVVKTERIDLRKQWKLDLQPTHIINLAVDGSSRAFTAEAAKDYLDITLNFLDWAKDRGVRRVFHASTGACYGYKKLNLENQNGQDVNDFINEADWIERKGNLVNSRLKAEKILREAARDGYFELTIGRLFTFSGRHILKNQNYAISQFIRNALEDRRIEVYGSPKTTRSYLDASDMSHWILKSLHMPITEEILQIGSNTAVTISDLANLVGDIFNAPVSFTNIDSKIDRYLPDTSFTISFLDVPESISWQDSVRRCANTAIGDHNWNS